jgi:hypothetical protein
VKIIASIEDPQVIGQMLAHLQEREGARAQPVDDSAARRPRGPLGEGEFDLG